MSASASLIDSVTFGIIAELHKSDGMRYVELKSKLGVADSTLTKRLGQLKSYRLLTVEAKTDEGRNYIVYQLTKTGHELARDWKIPQVVEKDRELTLA